MTITIGNRYRFAYPDIFVTLPDYTAHAEQMVCVLSLDEPDRGEDGEASYNIVAPDGWQGVAFASELEEPSTV